MVGLATCSCAADACEAQVAAAAAGRKRRAEEGFGDDDGGADRELYVKRYSVAGTTLVADLTFSSGTPPVIDGLYLP